jgi:hypothetical protein
MKTLLHICALLTFALLGFTITGCSNAPKLERAQMNPPSGDDLVGTYSIIEDTVSGLPLTESSLDKSRIEIHKDGTSLFTDFPLFEKRRGIQGIPQHRVTKPGTWFVASDTAGYNVTLTPDSEDRIKALVVESGQPSDLIIYYAPATEGFFTKWRKAQP